jgi:serine/threonine protein kinase
MSRKQRVKTAGGNTIELNSVIGAGGEGRVYQSKNLDTGGQLAVKLFNEKFATPKTLERTRFLVGNALYEKSSVIVSPFDVIDQGSTVGHCAEWIGGISLEKFLETESFSFMEAVHAAIALCHSLDILHGVDIAQGDLHAENVKVVKSGDVPQIFLLDLDNFNAPKLPPPSMIGQNLFLPPELREALSNGKSAYPDIYSDRFELAVLLHEMLLLRHPAAGYDHDPDKFNNAMRAGVWLQDPSRTSSNSSALGGYPVTILDVDISRLFRRGFSRVQDERPSASEWKTVLMNARSNLEMCPLCGEQFVVDSSKINCPVSGCSFPPLRIKTSDNRIIPLDAATTVIGRKDLTNSEKVSERHAYFHRKGPGTFITPIGSNPTCRWSGSDWIPLANDKPAMIQAGDRLLLGDQTIFIIT